MTTQKKKNTDSLPADPPKATFNIRCPRLGHQINFDYCRIENNGIPCFRALGCWYSHFNVHDYFKDKLTDENFRKTFLNKGKPKVFSLLNLIEQAKLQKGKQV